MKQAQSNKALIDAMAKNSPGAVSSIAITSSQKDVGDATRLLSFIQGMVQIADKSKAGGTASGSDQSAAAPSTRTVNINIGGQQTAINIASQADSDNLVAMLRQLETAAGRAA